MSRQDRWQGRPWVAVLIRVLVFLVPIGLSVLSALALQRIIPKPADLLGVIAWWVGIAAASTLVLWVADKGARRALPIAALFKLSLVFPDQAPSRYKIARKAGNVRDLQGELDKAREQGLAGDRTSAAETILTLVAHLSEHDKATRGHSERVRVFTDMLADELDLDDDSRDRLRWAALLHDVGKLTVHTDILNKPGKPTEEEWVQLKNHPTAGAEITAPLREWLGEWAHAVEEHHEKYDGSGYPMGLSGTAISWGARIVAVGDAYDTMTAARAYKKPMPAVEARRELATCAGSHFDPVVVRAFLNISLGRLRLAMGPLSWAAQGPLSTVSSRVIEAVPTVGLGLGAVAGTLGSPLTIPPAVDVEPPPVVAAPSVEPAPELPTLPAIDPEPEPDPRPDPRPEVEPDPVPEQEPGTPAPVPPEPAPAQPVATEPPPVAPPTVPAPQPRPPAPTPGPAPAPEPAPEPPAPAVIPTASILATPGDGSDVAPGETIAVTVRVSVPADAEGGTSPTLSLPIPDGATVQPGSLTVDGQPFTGPDPMAGAIQLPALEPGETVTIQYVLIVAPDATEGTVVTPTARVSTGTASVSASLGRGLTVRRPLEPQIAATATPSDVLPGATTDLAITVTNPGPGIADAGDLTLTATVPSGFTLVAGTTRIDGRSVSGSPASGLSLPALDAGQRAVVQVTGRVAATATGGTSLPVRFRVDGDRVTTAASATATVTVPSVTTVTLVPDPDPTDGATVERGDTIEVRYRVTNGSGSTSAASGRSVRAPVPAGTTYVPGSARADGAVVPAGATANPWEAARAVPTLAPGQSYELRYDVTVDATVANATVLGSVAQLTGGSGPLTAQTSWTVDAVSALDATLTAAPPAGVVVPGTTITFTSTISNAASASAAVPGVDVTASVPPELRYERGSAAVDGVPLEPASATSPFADGHVLGTLAPGGSVEITWKATLPIPSDDGLDLPTTLAVTSTDPDVAGVTRTLRHTSSATTSPSLLLTAPSGITAVPGEVVPFEVDISNSPDGTATVRGLRLTDVLPAGLSYAPGTAKDGSGASIESSPGDDPFDGDGYALPDLDPGQAVTYTFGLTVARPQRDRTVLPVQVDLATGAGTLSSDVDLVVDSSPSLTLDLTVDDPDTVTPGQDLVYTVRVTNDASATASATDVTVTFPTPSNTSYLSSTDRAGAAIPGASNPYATPNGIGDLLPGQSAVVTATFRVVRPLADGSPVEATLTVDSATTSPVSRTVSRTAASATVLSASPSSAVPRAVTPGDVVTLTYTFSNDVSATATAEAGTVTIVLPAGLTYVADTATVEGSRRGSGPTNPFGDGETIGALPPGRTRTVSLDVRVDAPQADGTALDTTADLVTPQQSVAATEQLQVSSSPSASVTVTAIPDPANVVTPGTDIVYTLTISNDATATESLRDVRVVATLPDHADTGLDATSPDLPFSGQVAASIAPGSSLSRSFTATVLAGPRGILQQVMTVDWEQDRSGVSRVTQHTRDTAPVLDIEVTSTPDETTSVSPGDRLTYSATITNTGDAPATNVTVAWPTPSRSTLVSFTDLPPGTTLLAGASATVSLAVDVTGPNPPGSVVSGTIDVDADQLATPESVTTRHAIAEPTVTVTTEYVGNAVPGELTPGERVTVRTTIANTGSAVDATDIDVAATVPTELTYVNGTAAEDAVAIPDADPTTNPLTEATPYRVTRDLAPGQQVVVTYDATVASPLANGTVVTATADVDVLEVAATVSDSATATVESAPTLTVDTTATPVVGSTVSSGQTITYQVKVSNDPAATDAARDVTFTLPTPAGSDYGTGTSAVDRPSTPLGTFETVPDGSGNPFASGYTLTEPLAPGETTAVTLAVTVTGSPGTSVDLSGSVSVAAPGTGGPAVATHQVVGSPVTGLVISEVRFDGVERKDEVVELYNRSGGAIDISGVTVRSSKDDRSDDHRLATVPAGTILPAHHHYLLVNEDDFTYPGVPAGWDKNARKAFADLTFHHDIDPHGGVRIEDAFGTVIDEVGVRGEPPSIDGSLYLEGQGLPVMPTGTSTTYERRHGGSSGNCIDTDANEDDFIHVLDPADVTYSRLADGPTPCAGAPAPLPATASTVVISQIRADGPAADGLGGNGDEFIELFNSFDKPVDIGGWDLVVDGSRVFTFDPGVTLEPGQYLLLGARRDFVRNYYIPPDPSDPTQTADARYGPAAPLTQALGSPTLSWATMRTDGVAVIRDAADVTVDAVSLGDPGGEGQPLVPLVGRTDHSYERRNGDGFGHCVDTQDNRSDFRHLFQAQPRNRTAPFDPCPPQPVSGPTGDLDVTITDSDGDASVAPGQTVTYTVTISNGAGSGFTATGVSVTYDVSRLTVVSANLDGAAVVPLSALSSGVAVTDVAPGETRVLTITGTAPAGGPDPIVSDTAVSADQLDSPVTDLDYKWVGDQAAPSISIVADPASGTPVGTGRIITYTMTMTNDGTQDVTDIQLNVPLPGQLAYIAGSAVDEGGDAISGSSFPFVSYPLDDLDPGETYVLSFRAQVQTATEGAPLVVEPEFKAGNVVGEAQDVAQHIFRGAAGASSATAPGRRLVPWGEGVDLAGAALAMAWLDVRRRRRDQREVLVSTGRRIGPERRRTIR